MKSKAIFLFALMVAVAANSANAQNDLLYRIKKSGKVSKQVGKITEITPVSVSFNGRSGAEKIPVWEIQKLAAASEPSEVEKARDRIEARRFDEAIELLDKVKAGDNPITDAEVAWYKSVAISELAFSGGGYSCLLYTSPSPRDRTRSRMPSSA